MRNIVGSIGECFRDHYGSTGELFREHYWSIGEFSCGDQLGTTVLRGAAVRNTGEHFREYYGSTLGSSPGEQSSRPTGSLSGSLVPAGVGSVHSAGTSHASS